MNSHKDTMNRRSFLGVTAGAAMHLKAAAQAPPAARSATPPNIVYVFSDEHRYQSMSFTELDAVQTPTMARMAQEGFSFRQCISNYPVCSPHRAILMTGRWPYQTGVTDNNILLQPEEVTLGKVFKEAGYETGYIGKWHLGGTRAEPYGFDHSLIWSNTNTHYDKSFYHPAEGPRVTPKGYNATLMTDQAIEFMRKDHQAPYMLMLSLNPPHANFLDAPPEQQALYADKTLPYRPNVRHKDQAGVMNAKTAAQYPGYLAHITAIDRELGRIMDTLRETGQADNTILVYSSDHGTMFGSQGVVSKRQPFEESIRVPFLVHAPGSKVKQGYSDRLFGSIDIMPTLCGLAGVPVPGGCMGQDFSPVMTGAGGPDPDSQFIMHISKLNSSGGNNHPAPIFRGVRTRTHTFAIGPEGKAWLFDNRQDPYQMNNLADDAAHAEFRKTLEAKVHTWLKQTEDPFVWPDS